MAILGISFSSREIGLAIVNTNSLIDYRVRLFKEHWSQKKAQRIIAMLSRCIEEHNITNISLILPHEYHWTQESKALITNIKVLCGKKINLSTYPPEALNCFCKGAKTKKKALMKELVSLYPELTHIYRKETQNKHKYYIKLFEAIGAAILLYQELL